MRWLKLWLAGTKTFELQVHMDQTRPASDAQKGLISVKAWSACALEIPEIQSRDQGTMPLNENSAQLVVVFG